MALQIFRADQHPFEVTTLTVDQVVWFKGCEAAACLGYARPNDAIRVHVDEEDRKTYAELMSGYDETTHPSKQQPHAVYVNESGLWSLVLRSQKEEARIFKRWVTSEVLPSIRQSGGVVHVIQHKVLCTAKPQCPDEERRPLDAGKAQSSEEVEFLNELENIVQLSTWLDSSVRAPTREARRKLLTLFGETARRRGSSKQKTRRAWCP